MKKPKVKVGTVILRWNGMSNDKGIVFSTTKKEATVMWKGIKEEVEKDTLKWQKKYDYDKKEWIWNWKAPAIEVEQTFVKKTEGAFINTYNAAGKMVSMKLTEKAYKQMGREEKKK